MQAHIPLKENFLSFAPEIYRTPVLMQIRARLDVYQELVFKTAALSYLACQNFCAGRSAISPFRIPLQK